MIDPKLLRTELDTVAEKLANAAMSLIKHFGSKSKNSANPFKSKPKNYKPKKMRAPNKSA